MALITSLLALSGSETLAVSAGQVDDFEDGSTQGWIAGESRPNPPVNISTGGPLGIDDSFLRMTSQGGFGPGSNMISFNESQWTGDYLSEGIGAFDLTLRNPGDNDLLIRLAFRSPNNFEYFSTIVPIDLPQQTDWATYRVPIGPDDLTPINFAADTYQNLMSGVTQVRLLHSLAPAFQGDSVEAILDVDNITAVVVPEPASIGTLLSMLLLAGLARRR